MLLPNLSPKGRKIPTTSSPALNREQHSDRPVSQNSSAEQISDHIKILHIITDLAIAGAETKLYKLLVATDRARFAPVVISLRDGGELGPRIEALGVPIFGLGIRRSLPGPRSFFRLINLVRQLGPDLIHGWMYHGNLAAQVAATFCRKKPSVLWSIRQCLYTFAYEKWTTAITIKLGARISRLPDRIIYVSEVSARQHEAVGYYGDRAQVLYYGFDTDTFAPSTEARRSLRSELKVAENSLLIGLIGRYHPVKDHDNFLKAAALLLTTHPDTQFVLCGKHVDSNNKTLRKLIQQLRISEQVHLLGERNDIPRITAALDISASSSHTEGFPNVIGEAMASGVPCVATDVSDLAIILGKTGRIVPPRNPMALAASLAELIEIGPEDRVALGARARARIIANYSLDAEVAQYESIYERTIANAKAQKMSAIGDQIAAMPDPSG